MSPRRLPGLIERHADSLFALEAVIAATLLVYLGLGLTFIVDEWTLIEWAATPSVADLVRPFNGHWSAVPAMTYRALLETFGLRSYVPFHALAVGVHVATATALYVLVKRRAGAVVALSLGGVILLFGTGHENLFSAFQVGFVGSIAAGLWALLLLDDTTVLDDRRRIAASALFVIGLLSSSPAVMALVGAIAASALRRDVRTVTVLAIPVATYLLWQVAIRLLGMAAVTIDLGRVPEIPGFVASGLATASGGALGLPEARISLGALAVAVVAGAIALDRGWRPTPTLQALALSVVALFTSIALTRGGPGLEVASSSRYLYAAAPLVGIFAVEVWRALQGDILATSRRRRVALMVAAGTVEFALVANIGALVVAREAAREGAADARAAITVLIGPGGERCTVDVVATVPEEVVLATMPGPPAIRQYVRQFGDPRVDVLAGPWLAAPDHRDIARARSMLCGTDERTPRPAGTP